MKQGSKQASKQGSTQASKRASKQANEQANLGSKLMVKPSSFSNQAQTCLHELGAVGTGLGVVGTGLGVARTGRLELLILQLAKNMLGNST